MEQGSIPCRRGDAREVDPERFFLRAPASARARPRAAIDNGACEGAEEGRGPAS